MQERSATWRSKVFATGGESPLLGNPISLQQELGLHGQILRNINDSIVVVSLEGRITYWNNGATRLYGYQASEVLGLAPEIFYTDRHALQAERDWQALLRGEEVSGERCCRCKDGSEIFVDLKLSILRDLDGAPVAFVGIGKDVTARKAIERLNAREHAEAQASANRTLRLQQLTELLARALTPEDVTRAVATSGRAALDAEVSSVWLVTACKSMLELRATEGELDPVLAREGDQPLDRKLPICEAVRELRPVFVASLEELHTRYPGARTFRERRSWAAIPIATGSPALGVLLLTCTQDRQFTEADRSLMQAIARQGAIALERADTFREREQLLAREKEANRTKDEFLAMLGHELRNPLSPILTALQLIQMRDPTAMPKERSVIERQVRLLVRLVDDLLDVSRITRGKIELKRAHIELRDVISKAIEMTTPLIERRKQQLGAAVPEHGLVVNGDEQRLSQVVANLLNNAAKYTEPGGIITVSAAADGDSAVLRVRDTGMGIAPELQSHLFELFVQGERGLDRSEGGLGLGLTIVRSLVELHGGTVSAWSAGVGHGSEFTVRLPLAEAAAAEPTRTLTSESEWSAPVQKRVLVVDDNRDAAEVLADTLDALGCTTEVAYDGPEALAVASAFRPDLAFVDIGLPAIDGYEVARRMRAAQGGNAIALVAVTGYGQECDRRRSIEVGFAEHLVKPVELKQIVQVAKRLLRTNDAADESVTWEVAG